MDPFRESYGEGLSDRQHEEAEWPLAHTRVVKANTNVQRTKK